MSLRVLTFLSGVLCALVSASAAQVAINAPDHVTAGDGFSISVEGQGSGTLYLLGPSRAIKRSIEFGKNTTITGSDVSSSGIYQFVVCSSECSTKTLEVQPATAARLGFVLHPSRVRVSTPNAVNATAIVFDKQNNVVLSPAEITFHIASDGRGITEKPVRTVRGIATLQMDSRPTQGTLEVTAILGKTSEPRVIQQVASEACGLRMSAVSSGSGITLQTDPIRDCKGNPLPDGTIVSFTKIDAAGKSTVDTPIKKDRAVAQFSASGPARISVACGVVVGNEIAWGGR
jgi:hypothetical protein